MTDAADSPGFALSVVVPCFNERGAAARVLDEIDRALRDSGMPYEIIAVDDGSTDGTAQTIDESRFRLLRHPANRGYGAALKTGARAARFGLLAIIDADGTYPSARLAEFARMAQSCDMAVGARMGKSARIPWIRRPAKWIISRLADYLSGRRIPDLNSGMRVVRRELWERFESYFPDGFSLTTTITLAALTNGYDVRYEPIEYARRVGRSKIRPIRDTLNFVQLILRTVLYFDPLKVFVPLSLALFAAAAGLSVFSIVRAVFFEGRVLDASIFIFFTGGCQTLAIGALADLIVKRRAEKGT
ncbi:MAG: Undecaprenyl-phosphate 4-deoxy-4-formamido-L-arabinose transferase [candidate division BRC1 bacterium ADurb.BinA364]|nr:MAG: Undecaprenyl-phosphate 4-deoxy-4-formamido-L-arabinose transferase [candidate division BRC1 bacterium ADurb.BinA364]